MLDARGAKSILDLGGLPFLFITYVRVTAIGHSKLKRFESDFIIWKTFTRRREFLDVGIAPVQARLTICS